MRGIFLNPAAAVQRGWPPILNRIAIVPALLCFDPNNREYRCWRIHILLSAFPVHTTSDAPVPGARR